MHILLLNANFPSKWNGGHHGSTSTSFSSYFVASVFSFFFLFTDGPVLLVAVFVAVRPDSFTPFSTLVYALLWIPVDWVKEPFPALEPTLLLPSLSLAAVSFPCAVNLCELSHAMFPYYVDCFIIFYADVSPDGCISFETWLLDIFFRSF